MLSCLENEYEIGIDEAGRGCWWGPVYASAVIWPKNLTNDIITDSKKLSEKKREKLRPWIMKNCYYGIGSASSDEIDKLGISPANKLAMNRAIDNLKQMLLNQKIIKKNKDIFKYKLLIDGIGFKEENFKGFTIENIIKGDTKYLSIASASILAKTSRDKYCNDKGILEEFKKYNISKHKGYGTREHREKLMEYGNSSEHRKSFRPCSDL